MSIIMNLFFLAFISINLYTWAFIPQYTQVFTSTFLPSKSDTIYTVPVETFLPTAMVASEPKEGNITYNDPQYFDITWSLETHNTSTPV